MGLGGSGPAGPSVPARGTRRALRGRCHKAFNKQHVLTRGGGGLLTLAWSFPFFDIAKNLLLKTPRIPTIP